MGYVFVHIRLHICHAATLHTHLDDMLLMFSLQITCDVVANICLDTWSFSCNGIQKQTSAFLLIRHNEVTHSSMCFSPNVASVYTHTHGCSTPDSQAVSEASFVFYLLVGAVFGTW